MCLSHSIETDTYNELLKGQIKGLAMALDVRLTHCYTLMSQNPQGCFTDGKGKSLPPSEAMEKLDRMAQSLGEKIDQENELLKGQIKGLAKKKE